MTCHFRRLRMRVTSSLVCSFPSAPLGDFTAKSQFVTLYTTRNSPLLPETSRRGMPHLLNALGVVGRCSFASLRTFRAVVFGIGLLLDSISCRLCFGEFCLTRGTRLFGHCDDFSQERRPEDAAGFDVFGEVTELTC